MVATVTYLCIWQLDSTFVHECRCWHYIAESWCSVIGETETYSMTLRQALLCSVFITFWQALSCAVKVFILCYDYEWNNVDLICMSVTRAFQIYVMHIHTYIYTFHRSPRLSTDNRMWNMSKTYKRIQDMKLLPCKNLHSHVRQ